MRVVEGLGPRVLFFGVLDFRFDTDRNYSYKEVTSNPFVRLQHKNRKVLIEGNLIKANS